MATKKQEQWRRWYAANRERVLARGKAYRALNAPRIHERNAEYRTANRERLNQTRKEYRAEHLEHELTRSREYKRAHPQRAPQGYRKKWASEHPQRARLHRMVSDANRHAREAGAPGRLRIRDVEYLPRECVYCGKDSELTIDHAMPMSRGGRNDWSNITIACGDCNRRKFDRTPSEFLAERAA